MSTLSVDAQKLMKWLECEYEHILWKVHKKSFQGFSWFQEFILSMGHRLWIMNFITGYARIHIPIISSVSEHQPTMWTSFITDLHFLPAVAPAGLWYTIKVCSKYIFKEYLWVLGLWFCQNFLGYIRCLFVLFLWGYGSSYFDSDTSFVYAWWNCNECYFWSLPQTRWDHNSCPWAQTSQSQR